MKMLMDALSGRKVTYLDAENPFDSPVFSRGLTSLIEELGTDPQVLFIDEFYRIPDALLLLKQLRDTYPEIKVYASGSSSIEIHSHLKQSAVGRVRRTRIFPLSFTEWCQYRCDLDLRSQDPTKPLKPRDALQLAFVDRVHYMGWSAGAGHNS